MSPHSANDLTSSGNCAAVTAEPAALRELGFAEIRAAIAARGAQFTSGFLLYPDLYAERLYKSYPDVIVNM
jgi:hypothetical protein